MKTIAYKITDPLIENRISFHSSQTQTIDTLKTLIAKDLKIESTNIHIINPPTEEQIRGKNDFFILYVELVNFQRDIIFYLGKHLEVQIKDAYKMDFHQILKEMKREGIYFSKKCIKNAICLYSKNKKLDLKCDYPFLFITSNVRFEYVEDIFFMEYDQAIFIFSEYDKIETAYDLIDKVFVDCDEVFILNEHNQIIPKSSEYLYQYEDVKLCIKLQYYIQFYSIDGSQYLNESFEYNPTVLDAKERIAMILSSNFLRISSDNVAIFNKRGKLIHDVDEQLSSFQDIYDNFYYLINPYYSQQYEEEKRRERKRLKSHSKKTPSKYKSMTSPSKSKSSYHIKSDNYSPENDKNLKNQASSQSFNKHEKKYGEQKSEEEDLALPILFTFENSYIRTDHKEFYKDYFITTTIQQIKEDICNEKSIKKEIDIKCKSNNQRISIPPRLMLKDIQEKIIEIGQNGRNFNHLYIEIIDHQTNRNSKPNYDEYDDDDDDDYIKNENPPKFVDAADIESSKKEIKPRKKPVKIPKPSYRAESSSSGDERNRHKKVIEKPRQSDVFGPSSSGEEQEKQKKRIIKKPKPLTKPLDNDESDDKRPENNKRQQKKAIKISKPTIRHISEDDDSEPTKRSKPLERKRADDDDDDPAKPERNQKKKKNSNRSYADFDESADSDASEDQFSKPRKSKKEDENEKSSKTKKKPISSFRPKINKIKPDNSPKSKSKESSEDEDLQKYRFEYEGRPRKIPLDVNTSLKDNEQIIKQKVGIGKNDEIDFILVNENSEDDDDDDDDDKTPQNKKVKLRKFKKLALFRIVVKPKPKKPKKTKKQRKEEEEEDYDDENEQEEMFTYNYQTNRDEKIEKAKLNGKATVKTLREFIAKKKKVGSVSNVKIIFAGKELLSDLVLKDLEVGDTTLFAYIRTEKEIFLMTAKALKYVYQSSSNEEESEYDSN